MSMEFQFVTRENIKSRMRESNLTPYVIYKHFMDDTDECIYIVEDEILVGIVTPGDLYRFDVSNGASSYLNSNFTYIDEIDQKKAGQVFERIKTIHEVPVIKKHIFLGIVKSGEKKTCEEWMQIRQSFHADHLVQMEQQKKEILIFLEHTQANIYIYYSNFDTTKLKWNDNDWEIYYRKRQRPHGTLGLEKMPECDRKVFYGSNYSEEYVETFIKEHRMMRAITHNGVTRMCDISGRHFNVSNGIRKTCTSLDISGGERRICFIGPCIMFGAYVSDNNTIESYLQEMVNRIVPNGYEVQNCGKMGAGHFHRLLTEEFAKDDIIIYYAADAYEYLLWEEASKIYKNIKIGSTLAEAYNGIKNPTNNLLNSFQHCNHVINMRYADIIYKDIEAELLNQINSPKLKHGKRETRTAVQDYYIPWEIVWYYRQYIEEHDICLPIDGNVGAIVMNCNPFTKGHRYLVEYASSKVDMLFVFVVEEEQPNFAFSDRFQMVKAGTCDLDNVYVLPSGRYIISKETFSQYFEKDAITEVEDMDYDLHIFGDVIAKEFNIKTRFVGEEPFDVVTRKYNETMKRLLPQKGVEVIEIPRLKNEEQEIISASLVRKCLEEKKYDKLNTLLPESTIQMLQRACLSGN